MRWAARHLSAVQLKGIAPAVTSAHEATTFWSTTGEMGTRLMEPTGE